MGKFGIIAICLAGVVGFIGGWFFGWYGVIAAVMISAALGVLGAKIDCK